MIAAVAGGSGQQLGRVDLRSVSPQEAILENLSVDPAHRRQGVGRSLVQAAMQVARQSGYGLVRLEARPSTPAISSAALISMYQRLGFRQVGISPRGNAVLQRATGAAIALGKQSPVALRPPVLRSVRSLQRMDTEAVSTPQIPLITPSNLGPSSLKVTGTTVGTASGEHHPTYQFDFGTGEKESFDLDPWNAGKTGANINTGPLLTVLPELKAKVEECVGRWNFQRSIIDDLVDVLIAHSPVNVWSAADIPEVLAAEKTRRTVMHLLALKASINQRVNDIPNNMPTKIKSAFTKKGPARSPETVTINWSPTLAVCREKLKTKLISGEKCPDSQQGVKFVTEVVGASTEVGLSTLRKYGILDDKGRYKAAGNFRDVVAVTVNAKIEQPQDVEFNFGLNHLRFILFMEWRVVSELLAG
jgi:predicted GNAT family acetyltransferase